MTLIELLITRQNYPVEKLRLVLEQFNNILIAQVDNLHTQGTQVLFWQRHLEGLFVKLSFKISSVIKLLDRTPISYGDKSVQVFDISSIYILTRAIIENYLIIYYLHFDNVDDIRKEFRFIIYTIDGLRRRQQDLKPFDEDSRKILSNENADLETLRQKLEHNIFFKSLNSKAQKNYLNGCAKEGTLTDLLQTIDIKEETYKDIWHLQSSYAHSEFISLHQLRAYYKDLSQLDKSAYLMGELIAAIISISINHLNMNFKAARKINDRINSETLKLLGYFYEQGKKN
ncbi:hypothetical protein [Adhaeribacter terreus]|uniref:Uncharacterized protein n=1 Tax=Adhaeribacter terreus TaxID=529703 RepID=A0ABW0E9H0_9BACT